MTTILVLTVAANASARSSVAVYVDGPGGDGIRAELVAALPSETNIVDPSKLHGALSQRQVDDVETAVFAANGNRALVATVRQASASIGADAVILGAMRAGKGKRAGEVALLVVLASQDAAAVSVTVPIKKGVGRNEQWKKILGPLLDGLRSAAESGDEPTQQTPETKTVPEREAASNREKDTVKQDREATPDRPVAVTDALLVGFVGLDLGGRQFHYNQRVTVNTLPYDLPQGFLFPETPGIAVSVDVFPLARSGWDIARDIGVSSRFNTDFAKVQIGTVVANTQWYAWELNVRGRIPLGPRASSPFVGVEGGGGELVFGFPNVGAMGFNGAGSLSDSLPAADYAYLRLGADARIPFGSAALMMGAAYRAIVGAGQLATHFPRASIGGLDARVGASLRIAGGIEARVIFSYIRIWDAFNPRPTDTYIAGGGLDQFVNADLGVAAFF